MTKTRVTLAIMFLLTFAAGMAVGLWGRGPRHTDRPGPSWLTSALDLTPQQEQEMLKIWAGLDRSGRQDEMEKRRALARQRDEAIRALVPTDQHAQLDKVYEAHTQKTNELSEQRRKAFDAAVEKTKAILTPEQRAKYEQVLARRPMGRRPAGPGSGEGVSPRPSVSPATQPASETQPTPPATQPALEPATQTDVLR